MIRLPALHGAPRGGAVHWLAAAHLLLLSLFLSACDTRGGGSGGDESAERRAARLLAQMSLEQKVAQMIQGEIAHVTPEDVRQYGLGSVLNGGGSFPAGNKHSTVEDWVALADAYYEASIDTSGGGAGIPILWGTDAVHGHNNVIGATVFPHNIGLGAAHDADLASRIAAATSEEVLGTGIDWIFAPTLAVAMDPRWGRTYESYSSDPALVGEYAGGVVEALQSRGVMTTAKHFVGDGGTYRGEDQGDTRLDLEELLDMHARGYVSAIDAGVHSVMASFNSWNGDKIHGNRELLTDVLRGRLGFDGFVVSDWNGVGQVTGCTPDSCAQAINAGIDMVMVPEDWLPLYENTLAQVRSGEISRERIDEAVRRILTVKFRAGIMDRGLPSKMAARQRERIGHPEHRALAREAVRRSLVLLRNSDGLLPLDPRGTYLVTGSGADDIGMQSGGWTISWQGTGNTKEDFPGGTSILDGFRARVNAAGGSVHTPDTLPGDTKPDAAILVFGETPYAEGQGDINNLAWQPGKHSDLALIQSLAERDIPVVSVFITGRPRWVNAELNASTAFVVAWLPGSEGIGVADVLLADAKGRPQYDFTGRLPMNWPALDINPENPDLPVTEIAFPMGYGLSVKDSSMKDSPNDNAAKDVAWTPLPEEPAGRAGSLDEPVFAGGLRGPWKLYVGDEADWSREAGPRGAESARGQVRVSSIDRQLQEDARRIAWSGDGAFPSQVYFQYDYPVDLQALEAAGGALSWEFRVQEPPTHDVDLRMDCRWPCGGGINIAGLLRSSEVGEWRRVSLPLSCLAKAGTDLGKVDTPFLLSTTGRLSLDISEVVVEENPDPALMLQCDGMPAEMSGH